MLALDSKVWLGASNFWGEQGQQVRPKHIDFDRFWSFLLSNIHFWRIQV